MTILTVTVNPSIDSVYNLKDFKMGETNRVLNALKMVGGKGVNTSRVTTLLKQESLAVGFLGGSNGEYILKELNKEAFNNHFLPIDGESRNAITIMHNEGIQTELNEKGPTIKKEDLERLNELILASIEEKDVNIISLAGRIYGEDTAYYSRLLNTIKEKYPRVFVSVDTSGEALKSVLLNKTQPDFIKPNLTELSEFLGFEVLKDTDEIKRILSFTIFKPIFTILVSLGSEGAIAKIGDEFFKLTVPKISVVNPTGSGDATVAGFLTGLNKGLSSENTLRLAMACGVANALEDKVGFVDVALVDDLVSKISVEKL